MKQILRKLLSPKQIAAAKRFKSHLSVLSLTFFASSRVLSSLYYFVVSREFGREHQSVLLGRLQYAKNHKNFDQDSSPLLRRNIHRLEKGIIMQPRRDTFAANYILETVNAFENMLSSECFCGEERKWATDVLTQYFSIVSDTPLIRRARLQFNALNTQSDEQYVPYADDNRVRTSINQEELTRLFQQRRSTRWFENRTVDDEHINSAIEMASLAPSACNRQPYYFHVANGADKAKTLAKLAVGTGGFADNIPCTVAVVGDLSAYPHEKDRHLIYIDGSLAAMQFMLSLETMGLSSCPLNWPDIEFRERAVADLLQLPMDKRVIMLIAVGHAQPTGQIPFSSKKTTQSLRHDIEL